MSAKALKTIIGAALVDSEFCEELLDGNRLTLLAKFDLTGEEREAILAAETSYLKNCDWGLQVADRLGELYFSLPTLPEREIGQKHSDEEFSNTDAFLVECLAWGLLQAYDIKAPPVDVQEILEHPLPIFKRLTLLELSLGLYDAAYRSCLDGSRLIVVDPTRDRVTQRAGMARELYVAFCYSQRAIELHWPHREQPHAYSDFFARCLLMPAAWVQTACAETIPLETLAARFDVPIQIMTKRLDEVNRLYPRTDLGESLTEALFSLKEPWRDRFLNFVANKATNEVWCKKLPEQGEVAAWLSGSPGLYQDVRYMLHTWQRPRPRLAC